MLAEASYDQERSNAERFNDAARSAGYGCVAGIIRFVHGCIRSGCRKGGFSVRANRQGANVRQYREQLTLTGVSPVTVYFTDRPERIAGNMKTSSFIPFWSKGKDSFKSDPPNADISLLDGGKLTQIVVELQDPVLAGDDLVYTVKVIQGQMPAKAADVSVFIDIIGMPLTPFSYAGVARRAYRRAYFY